MSSRGSFAGGQWWAPERRVGYATHAPSAPEPRRALCGTRGHVTHVAASTDAVDCARCIFELVVRGEIETSDPRVTDAMRLHKRFPDTRE